MLLHTDIKSVIDSNLEVERADKQFWLKTHGDVINEFVNIGFSSMAALRRPLLQGEAVWRASVSEVGS